MKVDAGLGGDLTQVAQRVKDMEAQGYDAALSPETSHDPFFPLLLAAEHSQRIELMTSIAVAFARNPMNVAMIAHDLNAFSRGRFILGLGSQIKPHITKRFSMSWSKPAARMREFILALRAIWDNWYQGNHLRFKGEFYTHTLSTPMFTPTDTAYGPPRVVLAAVGPLMTEVAGEVADGLVIHAFTTRRFMEEVTLPAVERGLAKAGKGRDDFEMCYPLFVVSGQDEESFNAARTGVKRQISFYGSTPAYRPVLEAHGWGDLQKDLNVLSKEGRWQEMGTLIDDDILEAFAVVAEPDQVVRKIKERCAGMVDRVSLSFTFAAEEDHPGLIEELRQAS